MTPLGQALATRASGESRRRAHAPREQPAPAHGRRAEGGRYAVPYPANPTLPLGGAGQCYILQSQPSIGMATTTYADCHAVSGANSAADCCASCTGTCIAYQHTNGAPPPAAPRAALGALLNALSTVCARGHLCESAFGLVLARFCRAPERGLFRSGAAAGVTPWSASARRRPGWRPVLHRGRRRAADAAAAAHHIQCAAAAADCAAAGQPAAAAAAPAAEPAADRAAAGQPAAAAAAAAAEPAADCAAAGQPAAATCAPPPSPMRLLAIGRRASLGLVWCWHDAVRL